MGRADTDHWWEPDGPADLRDQVLADFMTDITYGPDGETVKHGWLDDVYTGQVVEFRRVNWPHPDAVEVDHIVSLEDAWNSGAWEWGGDNPKWGRFFTELRGLVPTLAKVNREKGGKNAAEWLPPNRAYWQRYVITQIQIKTKYELSATESELAVMRAILEAERP
jgi:hypothetical protein